MINYIKFEWRQIEVYRQNPRAPIGSWICIIEGKERLLVSHSYDKSGRFGYYWYFEGAWRFNGSFARLETIKAKIETNLAFLFS